MTNEAIDHEARRMAMAANNSAEKALQAIGHTQKSLDDHMRRGEGFELEVRNSLAAVMSKVVEGHDKLSEQMSMTTGRIHGRLDGLIRAALYGSLGVCIALVSYLWITKVGS